MEFSVEKYISNFIQNQFPEFYRAEGENFVLFMKAYYEWMEETGQPIRESRDLLINRDIDSTLEKFLEYFQKKYLYGIPFNVIVNKRFLLKHILDVYRSKGTIQCYKLLFKLIYNEDVDVYLPGKDVLRVSDGIWIEPKYLEVTNAEILNSLKGKLIVGLSSRTTAVVEDVILEPVNKDIIHKVFITNISPKGGDFIVGERIVEKLYENDQIVIDKSPLIIGSLDTLELYNSGVDFNVGDILKIASKDVDTGENISFGREGYLKVVSLFRGFGSLNFNLKHGGFGYAANANVFIYKSLLDTTGQGASFRIKLADVQSLVYNTDPLVGYLGLTLDAVSYGFPANTSANLSSTIGDVLSFANNNFGRIASLTNVRTGNAYIAPANVFVRSLIFSKNLTGSLSYDTACNVITGTGTDFVNIFANDDVVYLQSNSSNTSTFELQVIKIVTNSTSLSLYGKPQNNSTASAVYGIAPPILPSQFSKTDSVMYRVDGTVNGINEKIIALNSSGNNIVERVQAVSSGAGYVDGEDVIAYRYGILNIPTIVSGGTGYTNGDALIFTGGLTDSQARGSILTDSNGMITSVNNATGAWFGGTGYKVVPDVRVRSSNGSGAVLTTSFIQYDTSTEIRGTVRKTGVGKGFGFWASNDGKLNEDKYIQDSYYYQDYSYELRVPVALDQYKDILYNTFHTSGSELFGRYDVLLNEFSNSSILYEFSTANTIPVEYLTCDINDPNVRMSDARITVDEFIYEDAGNDLTMDNTALNIDCSNASLTSDRISINILQ
jgi:hypothetical protein